MPTQVYAKDEDDVYARLGDMTSQPKGAAGRGAPGDSRRLSDSQTRRRMLDAGLDHVAAHGLTVGIDHVRMEELIKAAGVSRASAYRQWPTRCHFHADLLKAIASGTHLDRITAAESGKLRAAAAEVVARHRPRVGNPAADWNLVLDVVRNVHQIDLEALLASPDWRSYICLTATFSGLPDGDLRRAIGDQLSQTEAAFHSSRAALIERLAGLIGLRLSGDARDGGWLELTFATGAVATGVAVKAIVNPELTRPRPRAAFGGETAAWSPGALAVAEVFLSRLEVVPGFAWTPDRLDALLVGADVLLAEPAAGALRPSADARPARR